LVLLGAPIGSQSFIEAHLQAVVRETETALVKVDGLRTMQCKVLLLRYAAVPRINHLLRCLQPSRTAEAARAHDRVVVDALVRYQGFAPADREDQRWRALLSLPVRGGGVGLLSAEGTAPLAYAASVADALRVFQQNNSLMACIADDVDAWLECSGEDGATPPWEGAAELAQILVRFRTRVVEHRLENPDFAEDVIDKHDLLPASAADLKSALPKLQKRLAKLHHELTFNALLSSSSDALRSHLLSLRQAGAGAAYEAIPSSVELVMSDEVFRHFCSSRQCIRDLEAAAAVCSCATADGSVRPVAVCHEEFCPLGRGTSDRHDLLVCGAAAMARASGLNVVVQHHPQGSARQVPDTELHDPVTGENTYAEVSVICPSQVNCVREAASAALSAAGKREKEKVAKYRALAAERGYRLRALVVESYGAFGNELKKFIAECADRVSKDQFLESVSGITWASRSFKRYWYQRLSVSFWRGSHQMFCKRRAEAARRAGVV
jgi:hypothetical protein